MMRFALLLLLSFNVQAHVYYADAKLGSDVNDGTSPLKAWKSLARIGEYTFSPGDTLLFRAGQSWQGQVWLRGSGEPGRPIVVGKYGKGDMPRLEGGGAEYTLKLYNSAYWEIQHLVISNYSSQEEDGLSLLEWEKRNSSLYVQEHLPKKAERNVRMKVGILIGARDLGQVRHIFLRHLEVHGVNGNIVPDGKDENGASKHNGGIGFQIEGDSIPTWWDDVRVENCLIRDVDRTGLFFKSSWDNRTANEGGNWTPSTKVQIRNTIFRRTGANALIVRVAENPVMEYNLFEYCAIKGSGNAAFSFNTDGALWQFNECRFTKANAGDNDAGGLDSDYRSKGTVLQYNYLHHNDFGLLVTGGGGSFNDGTIVRNNLIMHDGKEVHQDDKRRFAVKVSGGATNTKIYDNTIVISHDSVHAIFHKRWKVWPQVTRYETNLLVPFKNQILLSLGESSGNEFEGNRAQGGLENEWFKPRLVTGQRQDSGFWLKDVKKKRIGPTPEQGTSRQEDLVYLTNGDN